ncbi:MAG: TetR/AcrR family transcriptional regulator [Candidatus Eisenbacteria bacterium]
MIGSETEHIATPHVRAKRERRRAEILRAALRSFRERGYHATTLDTIAEQLGVRKTALYHYFADKPAILLECHRESIAELERIVAEAARLRTARERLRHIIVQHVRIMTEAYGASPLAFEVTALAPERQAEIIAGRDRYERALRAVIESGMRSGTFVAGDAKIAAFMLLGALNGIARWYRPGGALDAAAIGEQFARQLVDGLARPARVAVRTVRRGGAHRDSHAAVRAAAAREVL